MSTDEIKPRDILRWQNTLIQLRMNDGSEYSNLYFKLVQSQLSAIFNHAVRYYELESNPIKSVMPIAGGRSQKFQFWTKEEFYKFIEEVNDNTPLCMSYKMLYWCGIREGELLALTKRDFEKHIVSITKTFFKEKDREMITRPKTLRSIRKVWMPGILSDELLIFLRENMIQDDQRIFTISKSGLNKQLKKYAAKAGVTPIRIHDLGHSHVSLLIHMGFSAVAIGKRVGHKSERITFYYAHLFPGVEEKMAEQLNEEMKME